MKEGTLVEWTVDVGDVVEEEETIAIVETDKVTADVEAREAGVIRERFAHPEDVLDPGDPIGILAGEDEDIQPYLESIANSVDTEIASIGDGQPDSESKPASDSPSGVGISSSTSGGTGVTADAVSPTDGDINATPGARKLAGERGVELSSVEGTGPAGTVVEGDVERALETATTGSDGPSDTATDGDLKATPGAQKLAGERGVELSSVEGTGPAGTVVEGDIERALAESADGTTAHAVSTEETERLTTVTERATLTGVQKRVGERLQTSFQTAPHVTLHRTYSTDTLNETLAVAERLGVDVSVNDVLLKASAEALSEHPEVNAHYEDGEHAIIEEQNVAFAVDTDDGLVTPVVPSVADQSIESVSETRRELTERALGDALSVEHLQGGTFTVTNLGMFGVDRFTPIINPPQIAILGVGREREDGTMTLSLSFDHRVINGADAAKFLSTMTDVLTAPDTLDTFFDVLA